MSATPRRAGTPDAGPTGASDREGAPSAAPDERGGGPFILGLTGPIGCGKSTAASHLARLGGTLIDADALARDVTAPGEPAVEAIRRRFGPSLVDPSGGLDRAALARIVFADPVALGDLEAIVHPGVRRLVGERLERATSEGAPFVVLEAIKLVEGGLAARCDEVWIVTCERGEQRARLARRGLDEDDIERRLATQGEDLPARLSRALAERPGSPAVRVVSTSGALEATLAQVDDLLADALAPVFGGIPPLGGLSRPR